MPKRFDSWEEAARDSKMRMAVSGVMLDIYVNGKARKGEIVMPLRGSPYMVYAGGAIVVHGYKPSAKEIDGVRFWKPYV